MSEIVGGGAKKVLYTLNTVRRIGLKNSAKALTANNTCKACALGMGGQQGGMTNELGEFPSVCNKSIQAQSTDIQSPIPNEIFQHSLEDLKALSGYQIEHLGRLNTPIYKTSEDDRYHPISWSAALDIAAKRFNETDPDRSFFYSSGRSSNEAGFILQLLARLYGTNNVNNCSYYCHQASGVGLGATIGSGTSTVELADIAKCDVFFLIGANPASNHPRLIHQLKALRDRGGHVVVINPAKEAGLIKFSVPKSPSSLIKGGDNIASFYLQPNIGSDIWLLKGIAKSVLSNAAVNNSFIRQHADNFERYKAHLEGVEWPEIEKQTGLTKDKIGEVAQYYCKSTDTIFAWGMGITHHLNGCDNVEAIANLALMRGMIGRPGAGLLPLRGHSNVQGVGTIGVKPVLANDVISAIENNLKVKLPESEGMDTMACLNAAEGGAVDAALIMGGNLFEASPHTAWAKKSLDSITFKLFLTTTLNKGHVNGVENSESLILPVAARDEEKQSTTQESMFSYVRLSDGGIVRLDNVRSESDILSELGSKIVAKETFDFSVFQKHQTVREAIAGCVPGMEGLASIGVTKKEFHISGRVKHEPIFSTPNMRAQFARCSNGVQKENGGHAFMLTTVRSEGQFNTIIYEEEDSYRGVKNRWSVLMSQSDMDERDLKEGDKVDLVSSFGKMQSLQVKAFDLPKGNLMAYYPEANVLVGGGVDPRSKTPAFKSVPVSIQKTSLS
ncbi:MAG: FdhF/YdeP family oxidoreductase [Agarilytica sp.]